jgi:hypothetical protein
MRPFALVALLSLLGCGALAHDHHDHHSHLSKPMNPITGEQEPTTRRLTKGVAGGYCNTTSPSGAQNTNMKAVMNWAARPKGPSSRQSNPVYTIPVIVHVMANATHPNAVSDFKLQKMIDHMNNDFDRSNAPYIFTLYKTTITVNDDWYNCTNDNEDEFKEALYEGGMGYLNVYMCNLYGNSGSFGFATLPGEGPGWRDGIGKTLSGVHFSLAMCLQVDVDSHFPLSHL